VSLMFANAFGLLGQFFATCDVVVCVDLDFHNFCFLSSACSKANVAAKPAIGARVDRYSRSKRTTLPLLKRNTN